MSYLPEPQDQKTSTIRPPLVSSQDRQRRSDDFSDLSSSSNHTSPQNVTPSLSPPSPSPTTVSTIAVNSWTRQTMERLHALFFSHTNQYMLQSTQTTFVNLFRQHASEGNNSSQANKLSEFFLMVGLWGLVRMCATEDFESRRQFGLFVNHIQDAEHALLKAIQICQKGMVEPNPIPSSQIVHSLPVTTQQITNI
jgi:hypothetical protein